jgi:hypothetical protein
MGYRHMRNFSEENCTSVVLPVILWYWDVCFSTVGPTLKAQLCQSQSMLATFLRHKNPWGGKEEENDDDDDEAKI